MKKSIVLYLQVHQPYRLKPYAVFDIAHDHDYFNDSSQSDMNNRRIFERVCEKSYRPMNTLLEKLLNEHEEFKITLSLTGTFIEQARMWAPDVLDSFKQLVATGKVELLAETYHHSLAYFYSQTEFERDVALHQQIIYQEFGVLPSVFRNTELAYNNSLAQWAEQHGYKGILAEGWDKVLGWRSPNYVYQPIGTESIRLLLKNYRLSDDIAFRFGNISWKEWPLTAHKYARWLSHKDDQLINLFMDYETFGEHQWQDTGIFNFFDHFVSIWLKTEQHNFMTVSDAITSNEPKDTIDMPEVVTWADTERDLSAWNGNALQKEALKYVYALEKDVLRTHDTRLIEDWRRLLTSDLTYYLSTKSSHDGSVHNYFSPYDSPYQAFLAYMNVIRDIRWRIREHERSR